MRELGKDVANGLKLMCPYIKKNTEKVLSGFFELAIITSVVISGIELANFSRATGFSTSSYSLLL